MITVRKTFKISRHGNPRRRYRWPARRLREVNRSLARIERYVSRRIALRKTLGEGA